MMIQNFISGTILATLPRTQRGMPLVLGGDPKGKTFLYTNGNSVIIRDINVSMCLNRLLFFVYAFDNFLLVNHSV